MRRLITGVKNGKSCVVKVLEFEPGGEEIGLFEFTEFSVDPPPARPDGHGETLDLKLAPGKVRWVTSYSPPNGHWPTMHHTDSIDCHTVISGSCELILDDGPHRLSAGDCVVVNGVDHAWRTGEEGCVSSSIFIGTPPPA